jgi:DNA replication regulator SLD3
MYSDEDDFVVKWWEGRSLANPADVVGESREAECRRLVGEQRFRETQLQIILMLEIIALESATALANATGPKSGDADAEPSVPTKSRQKKPEDLKSLLDLLLDRLCIWQSLSTDQGLDNGSNSSKSKPKGPDKKESDVLRDFCAEVIIPFYASRLPDRCKVISRKLGGLNSVSPARPPLAKAASTSQVLPGATIPRERPEKHRRSLHRVLTDEKSVSQQRPPSLSRSNAAPSNRPVKRDESEPVHPVKAANRRGIQKSKRIDNREVDLDAVAKQHEAKIKKMNALKEQKKELDDAINALRKPNRSLVSRDFADSVAQRTSSSSRKAKNPLRNPTGVGVQVMATPRVNRRRDVGLHRQQRTKVYSPDTQEPDPPSSEMHIPSSAIRPVPCKDGDGGTADANNSSRIRARTLNAIQETPSRGHSRQSDPLGLNKKDQHDQDGEPPLPLPPLRKSTKDSTSPFKVPPHPLQTPRAKRQRHLTYLHSTPTHQPSVKGSNTSQLSRISGHLAPVTPLKYVEIAAVDEDKDELALIPASSPPVLPGPRLDETSPRKAKSIYESLGWDNYDDDIDELA